MILGVFIKNQKSFFKKCKWYYIIPSSPLYIYAYTNIYCTIYAQTQTYIIQYMHIHKHMYLHLQKHAYIYRYMFVYVPALIILLILIYLFNSNFWKLISLQFFVEPTFQFGSYKKFTLIYDTKQNLKLTKLKHHD